MILVTGGAGFIGANFVLDWIEKSRFFTEAAPELLAALAERRGRHRP